MSAKNKPVIVLSAGRSGSTLLQKLLNTNKELAIWGEHAGILNQIMNMSRVVTNSEWIPEVNPSGDWLLQEKRPLMPEKWTAWDGSFSKKGFNEHLKIFVDSLFSKNVPEDIRWGFKEIRYSDIGFMNFLSGIYPDAQFLLLLRNPIDSCVSFTSALAPVESKTTSDFAPTMTEIANKRIKPVFAFLNEALLRHPDKSQIVIFDRLVQDPVTELEKIARFLDLATNFDPQSISEIISQNIVSERSRTSEVQKTMLRNMAIPLLKDQLEWFDFIADSQVK